ncbi:DUF1569 domain-containing protein [Rapidithrix thailandica]|uniref:DUF1569 domain-containing protein n=1 Tax=Rapidithrix thailandica TaxID=413964 RepID=A0AAW9SGE0_9BACT
MKTIFDTALREDLIRRIHALDETDKAQWGKMNLYQMMKHCILWDEMALAKKTFRRSLLGRLFGKVALKDFIRDDQPIKKNVPTSRGFIVKEPEGDIVGTKQKWLELIGEYENYSIPSIVHPFFGKLTPEQVGYLAYKHADHHLRQFNN